MNDLIKKERVVKIERNCERHLRMIPMQEPNEDQSTYPHAISDVSNSLVLTLVPRPKRRCSIIAHSSHQDQGKVTNIA